MLQFQVETLYNIIIHILPVILKDFLPKKVIGLSILHILMKLLTETDH